MFTTKTTSQCCSGDVCDGKGLYINGQWHCCPSGGTLNFSGQCTCSVPQDCTSDPRMCYKTKDAATVVYETTCPQGYRVQMIDAMFDVKKGPMSGRITTNNGAYSPAPFYMPDGRHTYSRQINNGLVSSYSYSSTLKLTSYCDRSFTSCEWCHDALVSKCVENQWTTGSWGQCDTTTCDRQRNVLCADGTTYNCLLSTKPTDSEYCCQWRDEECVTNEGVPAYGCIGSPSTYASTYSSTDASTYSSTDASTDAIVVDPVGDNGSVATDSLVYIIASIACAIVLLPVIVFIRRRKKVTVNVDESDAHLVV